MTQKNGEAEASPHALPCQSMPLRALPGRTLPDPAMWPHFIR